MDSIGGGTTSGTRSDQDRFKVGGGLCEGEGDGDGDGDGDGGGDGDGDGDGRGNADEPHLQSCALIVHPVRVQLKAPAIRNQ